ncbi:alpha/beta hydrolase [Streptomyces sp. NBC_01498]|uniref:alpha/beta fold hydrolase n=1 Tax=Streptomyces sp. NBC_01498 TaxID=2975870 RepID=UPI002E7B348B|nr:alpha/beta hydrolase [Streptomyces sp. NBC_01498]WTL27010.1 alpha/beta hydrolase [Streptomyces sp. NBC_01498]
MTTRATPLLLLHTWGGDAGTWAPALRHLGAAGRHSEAPDLPGHGARAAEPFTVDGAVTAALSAAGAAAGATDGAAPPYEDETGSETRDPDKGAGAEGGETYADGARPVDVVGSGLGALVALTLAQRHPGRVRSLTLVGFPPAEGPEAARRPADTLAALERDGTDLFARNYVDSTLLSADPGHRELLRRAMAATRPEVLLGSLRATLDWRSHARAAPLAVPCLVLRGARDHRVAAPAADALAEQLGGVSAVVPGAGHVAYLDEPAAFAAALTDFHGGLRTAPAD